MSTRLAETAGALRRLRRAKLKLLELIAEAMLREAQSKALPKGKAAKQR
jgi:hypothetical protein